MTTWHPPGEGQWKRDDAHITTVMTGYLDDFSWDAQLEGFRDGFAHYGAMLAGFDLCRLEGYPYLRPTIAGAPPMKIWGDRPPAKIKQPGKPPPKLVFKLLFKLHPELRRRARRAAEVWETKPWRDAIRRWHDELRPAMFARSLELTRVDVGALDETALAAHLIEATEAFREMYVEHFRHAPIQAVVVGDFMVRVMEWTSASAREVLGLLRGASPASQAGATETAKIAAAVARDAAMRALVESDRPASEIVAALRAAPGDVGRATTEYLEVHGLRPITGLDLYHDVLVDLPDVIVRGVRAALSGDSRPETDAGLATLRDRVPPAHRDAFDEACADSRAVYGVRDDDCGIVLWRIGIMRRAVHEAGKRLAARGAVHDPLHALDAKPVELPALLRREPGPSADELRRRAELRAERDALEPPFVLGEAGAMPSPECFPPAVARMHRATMTFLAAFEGDGKPAETGVRGMGVSNGSYEGRARVARGPADFARIERGDVLIARYTSPAYNVLLPLLGAIVTERGGLLSHAAIVAREYGIPAVVDTKNALLRIPDGARVRVDGKTGVVEVLAAPAHDAAVPAVQPIEVSELPPPVVSGPGRVVTLRDATATEFGGKAKALAAAIAAKLPVPDGIALDADLVARIVLDEAPARRELERACAGLAGPWAVRSSAVGEDSAAASFAGQHVTILGVKPGGVLNAIAKVYASAHTQAAKGYRAKLGITGAPRMGVVIQTLLRPDISGVLFSHDPTGAREGRVIEATWGLGEALVSGIVTPDRYRITRDGKIVERTIGDKDIAIEARAGGGVVEVAIGAERARTACLDDARLAELVQLASRCEQLFGTPQDLEWAVAGGRIHLLQSRPVTAGR